MRKHTYDVGGDRLSVPTCHCERCRTSRAAEGRRAELSYVTGAGLAEMDVDPDNARDAFEAIASASRSTEPFGSGFDWEDELTAKPRPSVRLPRA